MSWCSLLIKPINLSWLLGLGITLLSPMAVVSQHDTMEVMLTTLKDGAYQLCTEPEPHDWRDGSGVCLHVVKQGTTLDGYYGYPHSSSFVCLRGQISENWLEGQGLVVSWAGYFWPEIPQEEFIWDYPEERLSLSQATLARREGIGESQVSWIVFQAVRLNMQSMYLYDSPRMTLPAQLCDWSFN